MGLDALLVKLQREAVTPVTPSISLGVTAETLPLLAVALVTPVTPQDDRDQPFYAGWWRTDTLSAGYQEAAVLAWLAQIGETDQAIVAEVLTLCKHDDDAKAYYLGRAGADPPIDDDRRCCSQCRNLRSGIRVVARPSGRLSGIVGYRPTSLGVLQWCADCAPNASDTDQRPGHKRWPGLIQQGGE